MASSLIPAFVIFGAEIAFKKSLGRKESCRQVVLLEVESPVGPQMRRVSRNGSRLICKYWKAKDGLDGGKN